MEHQLSASSGGCGYRVLEASLDEQPSQVATPGNSSAALQVEAPLSSAALQVEAPLSSAALQVEAPLSSAVHKYSQSRYARRVI